MRTHDTDRQTTALQRRRRPMLRLPNALARLRAMDERAHERAEAWLARFDRINQTRFYRAISLFVGALFAQPTATALFLRHWNDAVGLSTAILGALCVAILARKRGERVGGN